MFPEPRERRRRSGLQLRRLRRRLARPAGRRRPHRGPELALDLLREPALRIAHRAARFACWRPTGARLRPAPTCRAPRWSPARSCSASTRSSSRRPTGWGSTRRSASVRCARAAGRLRARQVTARTPLLPLRLPLAQRDRRQPGAGLFVAGLFGMFFLGTLFLQRVLDSARSGRPGLPAGLAAIGVMSLGVAPRLMMRLGGPALMPGSAVASGPRCWPARRSTPATLPTCCPRRALGIGAGLSFPPLMRLAMSGATPRTRAWPAAWSTRPRRSAARSASPCWRRSPPRAPSRWRRPGTTPPRRRSKAATTWRSGSRPGSSCWRSRWPSPCCAPRASLSRPTARSAPARPTEAV